MKYFLFLAMLSFFSNAAMAQQRTDLADFPLKGKVKSIQSKETHRYKKNGVFTPWEKSYGRLTLFNAQGYKTEFSEFLANDSLNYKILYNYFPKEKKSEQVYLNKEQKPGNKTVCKHDDKGNRIEETRYIDNQLDRRYVYTFDNAGNMTTMTGYKKDGTMSSKTTWLYDNKNNRTYYFVETPGYANSSRKYVYDEKGNNIEETWHNGSGATDFRFVRNYDANGNKIEELKYKGTDKLLDMVRYKYEYDKKGNWTKRSESTSDGADFHIEERTIIYY